MDNNKEKELEKIIECEKTAKNFPYHFSEKLFQKIKKIKYGYKLFIIFSLLNIFFSCGVHSINIKILKPANSDTLIGIRKLAVLDFDGERGKEISNRLIENIINNKFYQVYEREKLTKILEEQKLGIMILDPDETVQIGKLIGVDAIVSGSVIDYSYQDTGEVKTIKYTDEKTKQEMIKYQYIAQRRARIELSIRIASAKTGEILFAASKSETIGSDPQYVEFIPNKEEGYKPKDVVETVVLEILQRKDKNTQTTEEKAKISAVSKLPSVQVLLSPAINNVLNYFISEIAPHYISEPRFIASKGDKRLEQAFEFVKREMWDDAKKMWENILEDTKASKIYDSAHYNIGVYYETIGDLDKSEEEFTTAYKLSMKTEYIDAKSKIVKRKNDQLKLKEQMNKAN